MDALDLMPYQLLPRPDQEALNDDEKGNDEDDEDDKDEEENDDMLMAEVKDAEPGEDELMGKHDARSKK